MVGAASAPAEPGDVLDVVIVGGGLAGLTAARDLARAGNQSFVVLEARDRVGGRTFNHQLREGRFSEGGGQWMGPGQTALANLARELDIRTFDSDYTGKTVIMWDDARLVTDMGGETGLNPALVAKFEALARNVPCDKPWSAADADKLDRMTVADFLQQQGVKDLDLQAMKLASTLTVGTGIGNSSLLYYLSMLNFSQGLQHLEGQKGGAQQTRFVGGSQVLSITMAQLLGDRVVLRSPVTGIANWNGPVITVQTPGRNYHARRVIVALSPPLCRRIGFFPALPVARIALQDRWPAHGPMLKSAMVYHEPFWFDRGYNGQVFATSGPLIWSYDNSAEDKAIGVINSFLRIGDVPADPDAARQVIAKIYAEAMQDDRLLDATEFHMLDWGSEEYTISCVSPMPPGLLTSGLMPALTEPVGGIIWAGTETGGIWNGYMDGAVRSGHRSALQALQTLRNGGGA